MDLDTNQSAKDPAVSQPDSEVVHQTKIWYETPGKIAPEFRITAWFVCNVCQFLDPRYRRRGVLDFRSMCAHQCQRPDCSKKDPIPWAITNFAQAPHAVETTRAMLKILGLDEEDPSMTTKCFDGLWLCKNCPETMKAMEWEDLIRHSSRHSIQHLEKISMGDAVDREQARAEGKRPFTVSQLLSNKKEGKKKILLCVHCMPSSEVLSRAKSQIHGQTGQYGAPKAMDIHGIRQHLKVKHKIDDMRNEDVYFIDGTCHNPTTMIFSETSNKQPKISGTSDSMRNSTHISKHKAKRYGYHCWACPSGDQYNAMGLASHFRTIHSNLSFSFKHPEFLRQEKLVWPQEGR
ncbi:hypothetical protein CPB86DRAFT_450419 [Serendipita vermifera]|nr:hypothetical protein CPB86DRAFT_450419 [Serendipita vermifera]